MIRALLENGCRLTVLLLNQSEEKTTSVEIKRRLESHYQNANLRVEVRRHPDYSKKNNKLSKWNRKFGISDWVQKISYRDALINNRKALPRNFESVVRKHFDSAEYDYAWFNYMKVKPSGLKRVSTKIIVDMHDMQSARVEADVLPEINPLRRKKYLSVFTTSERKELQNCDIAISISPVETEEIERKYKPSARMETLKATDDFRFLKSFTFRNDIVFIGSNSAPNVDGLVWFIDDVFPLIAEKYQKLRFLIQGNVNRNKKVQTSVAKSSFKNLIIQQGFVESLADVYRESKVVICPIRYGTGMKIKVVEAMAYGKAIVGTSVAFDGISVADEFISKMDADDFSHRVLSTLSDDAYMKKLEIESRMVFSQQHSFNFLKNEIERIISL